MKYKSSFIRLSRYRNVLLRLKSMGYEKIFAANLAESVGVTPLQVRKDLSSYKICGNKKAGYNIEFLLQDLNKILGEFKKSEIILVGWGKIRDTLLDYKGFEKENITIIAVFDKNTFNKDVSPKIYPLEKMDEFIKKHYIKTAILAVPEVDMENIMNLMIKSGIKGILNFSPIKLKKPKNSDIVINNLDFALETLKLIYSI